MGGMARTGSRACVRAMIVAMHAEVTQSRIRGVEMHTRSHLAAMASGDGLASPVERRSTHEVRECFAEACALVAPFFDPTKQWGKAPLNHLAMQVLRERFGNLTSTELMIMLSGIRKLHTSRRTPTPASST